MDLIAKGREADVYAVGEGWVLRRFRDGGRSTAQEARILRWLTAAGYPVPVVHATDGADLVMERLHGPTMAEALREHPWRAAEYGAVLGGLHRELHELRAPEWLPPLGEDGAGDARVLHLDLHPENVLLTADGPRVIDWSNARAGGPEVDVAMTSVILRCLELPLATRLVLRTLLRSANRTAGADVRAGLPAATRLRLADPTLSPAEIRLVEDLQRRYG
ncbi:phosphotransferase [Streptomyces sp. NRRL F-5123]|uniref:phosphotransferase n=1 Tax=Streptomyces sp. NRRL F-5123 TaxID=1463856 RepID=UPI0004E1605B|nr:phosphotransferase [Streptomyces sp. NRRL F-5123]